MHILLHPLCDFIKFTLGLKSFIYAQQIKKKYCVCLTLLTTKKSLFI